MKWASSRSIGWNMVFWTMGAVAASCAPASILMDPGSGGSPSAVAGGGVGVQQAVGGVAPIVMDAGTTGGAPPAAGTGGRAGGGQGVGGAAPTDAGAAPRKFGCPTICPAITPECHCLRDIDNCYRVLRCAPPFAPCGTSAVLCTDEYMSCDFTSGCDPAKSNCREFCSPAPIEAGGAGSGAGGTPGTAGSGAGSGAAGADGWAGAATVQKNCIANTVPPPGCRFMWCGADACTCECLATGAAGSGGD
jgi:hypothetical protein